MKDWYKLTAIVLATMPRVKVRETLEIVGQQSAVADNYDLRALASLLKGRPTLQASIHYQEYS